MSDIDDIIRVNIIDELHKISTVNGFINNVSVLNGYLVHYANDLLAQGTSLNFPAVAVQPLYDDAEPNDSQTVSKNERVMRLVGAVGVADPSLVNDNINSLLIDVRKALAYDSYALNEATKLRGMSMGRANFNLPDSQDQYAFFEMDVIIKYIENWK